MYTCICTYVYLYIYIYIYDWYINIYIYTYTYMYIHVSYIDTHEHTHTGPPGTGKTFTAACLLEALVIIRAMMMSSKVLQCVAVCGSCCSVLQGVFSRHLSPFVPGWCHPRCCSVRQCVAVCFSVLQCVFSRHSSLFVPWSCHGCVCMSSKVLQCAAVCGSLY